MSFPVIDKSAYAESRQIRVQSNPTNIRYPKRENPTVIFTCQKRDLKIGSELRATGGVKESANFEVTIVEPQEPAQGEFVELELSPGVWTLCYVLGVGTNELGGGWVASLQRRKPTVGL